MRRNGIVVAIILAIVAVTCAAADSAPETSQASSAGEAGMVDIRSLVPDFSVDMRYAGTANFTGTVVTGYEAPRCYLLKPVAEALRRVELAARKHRQRLKVFDCYRPMRAVQHFVRWAQDLDDQSTKPQHYPNLDKRVLLGEYIASTSGHSRGATMDLTLMQCDRTGRKCQPLDMGTDFDFFDVRANTDTPGITQEQRRNRQRLRSAMEGEGFQNYSQEWWHYTLRPEPAPDVAFDFPVR
jgi:D-alanyl-D-alanine dipeptidase